MVRDVVETASATTWLSHASLCSSRDIDADTHRFLGLCLYVLNEAVVRLQASSRVFSYELKEKALQCLDTLECTLTFT